ncbi:MAG: carboxypeptidase regulatory-like domain-containing protein, partial [Chlorobi bacterium]|nr:carboxypeptidase regulatory-like domain-containing protein [Chlorobiota bacterium]
MSRTITRSLILFLLATGMVMAQQHRLYLKVEPAGDRNHVLVVKPGQKIHFSAKAFEVVSAGQVREVPIDKISWSIAPPEFGTFTAKGDLTVSGKAPRGTVLAKAIVGRNTLHFSMTVVLDPAGGGGHFEYTISGTVMDEAGNPIEGAELFAQNPRSPLTVGFQGKSGTDGKYTIKLPAGVFIVRAHARGYMPEYYDNVQRADKATEIKTDPNKKDITGIDFKLGKGGSITGKVLASADGSPIKRAMVVAMIPSNTPKHPGAYFRVSTDSNGEYTIDGMPAGKYIVQASAFRFFPQYYDHVKDAASATKVEVVEGKTKDNINFDLDKKIIPPHNPYKISGFVKDAAGAGIADATIIVEMKVSSHPGARNFYGRTNKNGSYSIALPEGTFLVRASARGFLMRYFDNARDRSQATPVTLNAQNTEKNDVDFVLPVGGKITGTVTKAADGSPVKRAFVFVMPGLNMPPYGKANFAAKTDSLGQYTISGLETGEYVVGVKADGFEPQFFDGAATPDKATKVKVTAGQTTPGIDFKLNALAGISGTVTDAASGKGISRAEILIEAANGNFKRRAWTGRDGKYHAPLPAGTYIVRAVAPHYAPEWYKEKDDPTKADQVVVATGASVNDIDFTLDRWGGVISGKVADEAGNPIAKAWVRVWGHGPVITPRIPFFGKAETNQNGEYEIIGLPPGKYYVSASAKGFMMEFYDDQPDIRNADKVEVKNNQTTSGIDFTLAKGGSISGRVIDEKTGQPIRHALVGVRGKGVGKSLGARTDADGKYTIVGLATGEYLVYAAAYKYRGEFYDDAQTPWHAKPVKVTAPGETKGIDFALQPVHGKRHKLTGTVVDASSGMPVSTTVVEAIDPATGRYSFTTTNEYGRYEMGTDYEPVIRASAIGYVGQYAGNTLNWEEGRKSAAGEVRFVLEPQAETGLAVLTGTVRDEATGDPVSNAFVYGKDE